MVVIFAPVAWLAGIGVVLWGLGSALGFPVGMSAAADDPRNAAARVSAVATIGYLAFLVGPPLVGFVGEHVGLLNALLMVLALVAVAGIVSPGRPQAPRAGRRRRPAADDPRLTPPPPSEATRTRLPRRGSSSRAANLHFRTRFP